MRYLIGVGNYTAGDDAIGPRIIEAVVEQGLDREFRAIDLSSNCLNLVAYLDPDTEAILIVDSARMGLRPGETRFFEPGDVETRKALDGVSTHEGDVVRVLALACAAGCPMPRLQVMGIEPESLEPGTGLSATIAEKTSGYIAAAIDRLAHM